MVDRTEIEEEHASTAILTVDDLAHAIQLSAGAPIMEQEDAKRMAEHMLNFFGYDDMIIDNLLETEDRNVFYMLEDSGLVTTGREDVTLFNGKEWRIHYWQLNKDKILELATKPHKVEAIEEFSIYDDIPDEVWESER